MPFEQLGLRDDASERDVRRAYAVLLKKTRPDDDPVAFQALHEAYQACLEELRYRQQYAPAFEGDGDLDSDDRDDDGPDAPARWETPTPRGTPGEADSDYAPAAADALGHDDLEDDTVVDESEGFNLTAFLEALYERCETATPAELEAWLNQQPDLYSINLKSTLTVPVLRAVVARQPPLRPPMLDAVAGFFGASQLGRRDWWLLEEIEQAKARAVAVDQFSAGRLPRANPQDNFREFDQVIDRRIASRRWQFSNLLLMLVPGVPSRINARINEIDHLTDGASLDLVDPRLRRIAATLADRTRVGKHRLALTWGRALAFGLPLFLYLAVVNHELKLQTLVVPAVFAAVFTAWQLLVAGYLALRRKVEQRGLGQHWREACSLALLVGAWVASSLPGLSKPHSGVFLAILGTLFAVTPARFAAAFSLVLFTGAAVILAGSMDIVQWPVSPAMLAVTFPGFLALAVDRLQARRTGRRVDDLATDQRSLLIAGGVSVALMVALIVLGWPR